MFKLILAAGVMIWVFNRLAAVLGTVQRRREVGSSSTQGMLDVTGTGQDLPSVDHKLIEESKKSSVLQNLKILNERMENFSLSAFVKGARKAMSLAVEASRNNDNKLINSLADSGIGHLFDKLADKFDNNSAAQAMQAKVCGVQMFNNKAFITLSMDCPKSRWTFSKHIKQPDPKWYITDLSSP